ncbi:MAG TPA: hypothetical protein PKN99_07740 [Cyclobacteriaceae bacterium]|nr:hypothetical protein [Cyclobacteriaceae bacterium]HNP07504.1 hypothetical protein [Cyclobacteriaceae bacterium]HRK54997.1 hypothetical protein [Cyclobacteriaceae bacterium]
MKLLSLTDFKDYSFDKKCDIVTIYSNYIMHREFPNGKGYLYHTGSFFIEVLYSSLHRKIQAINAFDDIRMLAPYAETVSLANLNF